MNNKFIKSFYEFLNEAEENKVVVPKSDISDIQDKILDAIVNVFDASKSESDNAQTKKFLESVLKKISAYMPTEEYNKYIRRLENILGFGPKTEETGSNVNTEISVSFSTKAVLDYAIKCNVSKEIHDYVMDTKNHFTLPVGENIDLHAKLYDFMRDKIEDKKEEFENFINLLTYVDLQKNRVSIGKNEILLDLFFNNDISKKDSGDCVGLVEGYDSPIEVEVKGFKGSMSNNDDTYLYGVKNNLIEMFEGKEVSFKGNYDKLIHDPGTFMNCLTEISKDKDELKENFIKCLTVENDKENSKFDFDYLNGKNIDLNNNVHFQCAVMYAFLLRYLNFKGANKIVVLFAKDYNNYMTIDNNTSIDKFIDLVSKNKLKINFDFKGKTSSTGKSAAWGYAPKLEYYPKR